MGGFQDDGNGKKFEFVKNLCHSLRRLLIGTMLLIKNEESDEALEEKRKRDEIISCE